jgi:hypothetical protein
MHGSGEGKTVRFFQMLPRAAEPAAAVEPAAGEPAPGTGSITLNGVGEVIASSGDHLSLAGW